MDAEPSPQPASLPVQPLASRPDALLCWGGTAPTRKAKAETLTDHLFRVGAIDIRPHDFFVFPSGFTTPAYCDLRLAQGDVAARTYIAGRLADAVRVRFLKNDDAAHSGTAAAQAPLTIVGVATGGIAYATSVADRLGLPLAYVRSAPKDHGQGRRVEGHLPAGSRCVVIDDVLGSGSAARAAVEALTQHGAIVLGVCAVFSYDFDTLVANVAAAGVPFVRLVDFGLAIERAQANGLIDAAGAAAVAAWYASKATWKKSST
ncbi:Orotate phosphoribosyltransferase [Pandoravirus kuranda]|uniref:orotate phosphoribosyltransferase n=1 Tax=Pandoravirus kuranda TaxID=3019033 RepID=A0AA95EDF1_9VIRU|nr:Orotate phosphoribosyltransferase [Pandoravirus kuranda]